MSKRVRFSEKEDGDDVQGKFPKYGEDKNPKFKLKNNQEETQRGNHHSSRLKLDNSLDSDEEGEKQQKLGYEKLKEDDVEGAEDDYEGEEVGITPFNLKEEMEEGDFDVQGNYHFKKENIIRDEWLDNIDWMKVKNRKKEAEEDMIYSSDEENGNSEFDECEILGKIVALMQPGETVTKALRRLGGNKGSKGKQGKRVWKKENVYDLEAKDESNSSKDHSKEEEEKRKAMLLELTGLCDEMTGAGHYDVYTDTFEKFQHKLNMLTAAEKAKQPEIPDGADDDEALDILASSIDENKEKEGLDGEDQKLQQNEEDVVKWEYKWTQEDEQVYGPFTSQQMAEWQEQDYFKDGVFVRRTDRDESQFYSSRRIDFDLYT